MTLYVAWTIYIRWRRQSFTATSRAKMCSSVTDLWPKWVIVTCYALFLFTVFVDHFVMPIILGVVHWTECTWPQRWIASAVCAKGKDKGTGKSIMLLKFVSNLVYVLVGFLYFKKLVKILLHSGVSGMVTEMDRGMLVQQISYLGRPCKCCSSGQKS